MKLLPILVFILLTYNIIPARLSNLNYIPNSNYIKYGSLTQCQLCHQFSDPILYSNSSRNAFGQALEASGKIWSKSFGQLDSDGDKFNNSSELACSDWTWKAGDGDCGTHGNDAANPSDPDITPLVPSETTPSQDHRSNLSANPNPFNPSTTISYHLNEQKASTINLRIYNTQGLLIEEVRLPGISGSWKWNAVDHTGNKRPTGIYIAKLITSDKTLTTRLILAR